MIDSNAQGGDPPFFSAVLLPHRSLGPAGFVVLMALVGAVSLVCGLMFTAMGAWPVAGFFGLDAALLWLAFRLNYRSARAFEEVSVSAHEIVLRKVAAGGRAQEFRFNPLWVRLEIDHVEDEGVTRIALYSRGRGVSVGAFLNADDRTEFAAALKAALAAARSGPPRPSEIGCRSAAR